jgi:hypothetical protein
MVIPAGDNMFVELKHPKGLGGSWVVRSYRRLLFFKRAISSDWFLDGDQAKKFAEQLAAELKNGSLQTITHRQPGWTLRRPR